MKRLHVGALAWLGALGPPGAWAVEHVAGYAVALANCPDNAIAGSRGVAVLAPTIAIAATAALIAALSGVAATLAWRATRASDDSDAPPDGRIHFLAVIGMTTSPLFVILIAMSGTGAATISGCVQS